MLFDVSDKNSGVTILIRLSSKCSSNCAFCKLPYLKENKFFDLQQLDNILNFCDKNCSKDFVIWILWYDLLNLTHYEAFYDLTNKYKDFLYSVQLSVLDVLNNIDKITFIEQKYKNVVFWIQYLVRQKKELLLMLKLIKQIDFLNLNLNVNFIMNFWKFEKIINLLKSNYSFYRNENWIKFNIGNSIAEFENDMWINDIDFFQKNNCVWLNNFYFDNNKIYIKNDIEITLQGDIKFHLNNFCNQGINRISSIYKTKDSVFNDFKKLQKVLSERNFISNKCEFCINNPIKF